MNTSRIIAAFLLVGVLAAPYGAFAADETAFSFSENPLAYVASVFSSFLRLPYCYMSVTKDSNPERGSLLRTSDNVVYPGDVLKLKWLTISMEAPVLFHDAKASGGFETLARQGTKTLKVGFDIAENTGTTPTVETFQIGPTQDKAQNKPSCALKITSLPKPSASSSSASVARPQSGGGSGGGFVNGQTGGGATGGFSGGFQYLPAVNPGNPTEVHSVFSNPFNTPGIDDSASKKMMQGQER